MALIKQPGVLYAEGLLLTPVMVLLSAAMETAAENLIGRALQAGPAHWWLFLASYVLCVAGALAVKRPLDRIIVLMIPVMVGLAAAVEVIGWTPRTVPGVVPLLVASYLLCVAGALAMKKPLGRTIVLMLVPVALIPLGLLLTGLLLICLLGLPSQ